MAVSRSKFIWKNEKKKRTKCRFSILCRLFNVWFGPIIRKLYKLLLLFSHFHSSLPFYVCLRTNRMCEKESCSICANATRLKLLLQPRCWLSAMTKLNSFQLSLDPILSDAPQPFHGDDMHGEKFRESASHCWLLIKTYLSFSVFCSIASDVINYFRLWAECQFRAFWPLNNSEIN